MNILKRIIVSAVCVILLLVSFVNAQARTVALMVGETSAIIDGKQVLTDENENTTPIVTGNRAFLPLRFASEKLEANVDWINSTQSAVVKLGNITAEFIVNMNVYKNNGVLFELDASPFLSDGRVYVPVRALSEALGKHVEWYEPGLIIISDNEITEEYANEMAKLFGIE